MSVCSKVNCCAERRPSTPNHKVHELKTKLSFSYVKPILRDVHKHSALKIDIVGKTIKKTSLKLIDAFVDYAFEFIDQPLLPSQSNFAPVEERSQPIRLNSIEGIIPDNFPEGIYIRNGPNPLFGGYKSTNSMFGKSSSIWVEGEGMLHALYFSKDTADSGNWIIEYRNKHVETDTYIIEKQKERPCFLPALEGDSSAIFLAFLFNMLRFGKVNKCISNTNVFEHAGRLYSIAESDLPQQIDFTTLENLGASDFNGAWDRPFTSHPKKAPRTGELVTMGIDAKKPFFVLGIISEENVKLVTTDVKRKASNITNIFADGSKIIHKADLKLSRCTLAHDIGVTERSNVILDFPLTLDINRLINGGPFMKFEKNERARIGVMPRYGDAESVKWFEVEPCSVFHVINCFEEDDEVIVWGCRARESIIIPGPDYGLNKFEWFSKGFQNVDTDNKTCKENLIGENGIFFASAYEWRLNLKNGKVKEKRLTGNKYSMDFPIINEQFSGLKNKYAYTQVVDSIASSTSGMAKYGSLAKLYFEEKEEIFCLDGEKTQEIMMKVEYHLFPENTYCTGSSFVPKSGGVEEDDGWIISHVHNEDKNISEVHITDTKKFSSDAVSIISLPCRVPYGFHGAFMPKYSSM